MSTFSTLSTVRTRLRGYLREADENQWLNVTLNQHISQAHDEVLNEMRQIHGPGWSTTYQTVTVAASTETYDLSGLTKEFEALELVFHVLSSGHRCKVEEVTAGTEARLHLSGQEVSSDQTPEMYRSSNGASELLHFLPLSSGIRTFRIKYRFASAALTVDGTALDTPARYDPLVARKAQLLALMDIAETNDAADTEVQRLLVILTDREQNAASKGANPRLNTDWGDEVFSGSGGY